MRLSNVGTNRTWLNTPRVGEQNTLRLWESMRRANTAAHIVKIEPKVVLVQMPQCHIDERLGYELGRDAMGSDHPRRGVEQSE